VLVILDGGSRDLGTSFELINHVIIPSLGKDTSRLLIAINQADMAMKGRFWDSDNNKPEPKLVEFLNDSCIKLQRRIFEATE
jgi:predicted GTPase